jgi:hypothetical protein
MGNGWPRRLKTAVAAKRDVVAGRARWKIRITIRTEKPPESSNVAACAVHIGWRRKTDGSIRVACLVDESGHQEELPLSAGDMERYRKLDDLRGIIQTHFNEPRAKLADWLQTLRSSELPSRPIPPPLLEACSTNGIFSLHQWTSASRLSRLLEIWQNNRFGSDEQMWREINHWYYGDLSSRLQHKAWKNDMAWSQARRSASYKPDAWNGHRHLHVWWLNLSD